MIPREYLKKIRQIEVRTNRLAQELLAGAYHSVFKGRGMDFEEVREYQIGDDVRTIDWNVSARTGITHIKKYREERELTMVVMVDVSASGIIGTGQQSKRDLAAEIASVLAFSATRNSDRVGLILFSDEVELYVPARKGRAHVFRLIREILFYEPRNRGTNCQKALHFLNVVFPRRAIVFLVSDFIDKGFEKALRVSNQKHDVIAVHISDPSETKLPSVGWVTMEDAETGDLIEVNTSNPKVRAEYEEAARALNDSRRRMLRRAGLDLIEAETDRPYQTDLKKFFERRIAKRAMG
ncbi:DUF58 domain-containing protein [Verrucomicrobia bacterium LW23]|nr:DUF58 domain-containing protein [Verrucomicrobia bacterium LW23]